MSEIDNHYEIEFGEQAEKWRRKNKGSADYARVVTHLRYMSLGNFGDTRQIEGNLYEKRVHVRGGIRIYYYLRLAMVIRVLGFGTKSTQERDIIRVKKIWKQEQERQK